MNWKMLILNILTIVLLAIVPTILGESLNNIVSITYLVTIIILSAILQITIVVIEKKKDNIQQLEDENSRLEKTYQSSILALKAQGINYFNVALQPFFYYKPKHNNEYTFGIIVNSKDKLVKPPEITLTSDKEIEVKKTNAVIDKYFHNDLHFYLLKKTLEKNVEDMFFSYQFKITFKEPGENIIKLLVESKELSSEIKTSFFIHE